MKTTINIKHFAQSLSHSDNVNQAEFINTFAKELKIICKDLSLSGTQPCSITESLDSNGVDLIKSLHEFILLREQAK